MQRLRLDLAYDGSRFHGWAVQPGLRTVQGEIEVSDSTGKRLTVPRGRSVWVAAGDGRVWVSGPGTAFRATDGLGA